MASIPLGLKGEHRRTVTSEIAIDFLGMEGARVLGTPFMIMLLEMAARNSLLRWENCLQANGRGRWNLAWACILFA